MMTSLPTGGIGARRQRASLHEMRSLTPPPTNSSDRSRRRDTLHTTSCSVGGKSPIRAEKSPLRRRRRPLRRASSIDDSPLSTLRTELNDILPSLRSPQVRPPDHVEDNTDEALESRGSCSERESRSAKNVNEKNEPEKEVLPKGADFRQPANTAEGEGTTGNEELVQDI